MSSEPCDATIAADRMHLMTALDLEALQRAGVDADALVDAVLDALVEVHDNIEGSLLRVGPRQEVMLHTSGQVCEWLYGLMKQRTA